MAQIDVSDLLSDPDFSDPMTVIRRRDRVNAFGENEIEEDPEDTRGSIQPANGETLQRLPEALRSSDVRSFWIRSKIVNDGSCQYPDIISYKGQRYTVQVVFDWMNYGPGFQEGTCVREKLA